MDVRASTLSGSVPHERDVAVPAADAFTAALKTMAGLGAIITDPADVPSAKEILSNDAATVRASLKLLLRRWAHHNNHDRLYCTPTSK
jgi:hypothetical protein